MNKKRENWLSLALLMVGIVWGVTFIAVRFLLDFGFSPIFINLLRFAIASVIAFVVFFKSVIKVNLSDLKKCMLPSLALALGFFMQNSGMQHTTPGNNAFITAAYIIMVPILSGVMFKKKVGKNAYISAGIAFIGIAVLSLPSFSVDEFKIGDLISLGGAFFFAMHFLLLGKISDKVEVKLLTFCQLLMVALIFVLMFFVVDGGVIGEVDWIGGMPYILFAGICSSFITYVIQTYAQKYVPETKVAIIMSVEAPVGAICSVALGLEVLTMYLVVGGILSMIGVIYTQIPDKSLVGNMERVKKEV